MIYISREFFFLKDIEFWEFFDFKHQNNRVAKEIIRV